MILLAEPTIFFNIQASGVMNIDSNFDISTPSPDQGHDTETGSLEKRFLHKYKGQRSLTKRHDMV